MRIVEHRRPAAVPPSPARQSFFLTGGTPTPPTPLPWLKSQQSAIQEDPPLLQQPPRSIYFPLTGGISGIIPFFIPSTAIVYAPSFINATLDAQLFINGISVQWLANPGDAASSGNLTSGVAFTSPTITKILGQNGTFTFAFLSTKGVLPQAYDEVIFYRFVIRRFGGFVNAVTDVVIVGTTTREYGVSCTDFNGYMDRVVIAKYYTLPMSGIISIVLFDFVATYLSQFGVTFNYVEFGDPGVTVGPLLFHYILLSAAVAQLTQQASGWYVNIDAYKVLRFLKVNSGPAAPYSITDATLVKGNVEAIANSQSNSEYRNRQWVLPSVNVQSLQTDSFVGDGVTTEFFTQYPLNATPIVYVNGNQQLVTVLGVWDVPYDWYYIPGGQGIFQKIGEVPIAAGVPITVSYPAQFQVAAMAENKAEIALRGLVESSYTPTDIVTQGEAQNLAQALLDNYCPSIPSQVEYNTNEHIETIAGGWVEPGDLINITTTAPAAAGDYIVQQITSQENKLTVWKHNVIARKQNGATDYAMVLAKLTKAALTAANVANAEIAVFQIAPSVGGVSNPGITNGPTKQVYIFAQAGVLWYWLCRFASNPPTGAGIEIDIQLNGNSTLPPGDAYKVNIADGQNTVEQGFQWDNVTVPYQAGDALTIDVLHKGAGNATDGVLQVVGLRST